MSSQEILTLLSPPDTRISESKALQFLDTRFSSFDDLVDLDADVSQADANNEQLSAQLDSSRSATESLVYETRVLALDRRTFAQELALESHTLSDDVSALNAELLSSISEGNSQPTLLEDIETLHRNLKELESLKSYVQVIETALRLSQSAEEQINAVDTSITISMESVSEYQRLRDFVSQVVKACEQLEGTETQQLRLVKFVQEVEDRTWINIKNVLFSSLIQVSERLGWPSKVNYLEADSKDRRLFEHAFLNLLELQKIGEIIRPTKTITRGNENLYPLQALLQPVSQRFKFHFESSRPTNKLDKPEWYFTHVIDVVHQSRAFMQTAVQNLLSSTHLQKIDAWKEFTLLLTSLPARKLRKTIPTLLPYPSILAHTIYQALAFDTELVENGFDLTGTTAKLHAQQENDQVDKWEGVSSIILNRREWFEAWLEGERKFVEGQYHEIISASDAWLITDDEGDIEPINTVRDLKATNSARRIKALVEQVTDRYSPLPHFSQRTRFLTVVQLPILEWYHGRISSSLDAFETLSSAFVRAVPGALGVSLGLQDEGSVNVDARGLTSGAEGIQRLCKAMLSAKYLEGIMTAWGEELFFLELWTEINHRASLRERASANSLLPTPTAGEDDIPKDTIFEELVNQYSKLVARAEDIIVHQIVGEIEAGLKAHFSLTASSDRPGNDEIAVSQTLLGPIALLSSYLKLIRQTLPEKVTIDLYRCIASRLSEHIRQRQILYRGHISLRERREITAECELWVETAHGVMGGTRNRVEAPWKSLLQAGRLLSADDELRDKLTRATLSSDDEKWANIMTEEIGFSELSREDVTRVLRVVQNSR